MAEFAVSTRFGAKDKVTKSFRDMDRGAARFGRTARKSFRDATASASRFRSVTKGILAAGAVQRGLAGLSAGLGSVTRQFIDFDQATIGAASRFKDIGPDAVDFEQQLSKIRDRAREAGATTEFTAAQSAAALDFLARAGFTAAEAMGSLDSMINLATASGEDFATVADYSSDLMGSFGLEADTTAKKIASLNRLNDVLVKSANSANVTIESQFETMKQAGPVSRIVGASLEEVAALTAALGNAGIKGTEGATALKNSMLRLAAPTKEVQQALDFLNITTDDGTGNMKKITAILGEVRDGLDGVGEVQQAKVLNALFGKRAIAGAKNLIESLEGIDEFEKVLNNAAGTSEKTAEKMRQSMGNRLKALGSAASEFGFKIIEAFEVRGEGAIDRLTKAIRGFDPTPIVDGIEFTIELFKNLIRILSPFKEVIGIILAGWLAYAAVMKIVAAAQAIVALTNPVTAIIVGLALVTAFIINWWEEIKIGWGMMFDGILRLFFEFVNIFVIIWGGVIKGILSGISAVAGFFGKELPGADEAIRKIDTFQADIQARAEGRTPPNQAEAEARREIGFEGRIQIAGAPEGSTAEGETTGAPPIDMDFMGA
jgi:TP901 family phage tail tape measure protein